MPPSFLVNESGISLRAVSFEHLAELLHGWMPLGCVLARFDRVWVAGWLSLMSHVVTIFGRIYWVFIAKVNWVLLFASKSFNNILNSRLSLLINFKKKEKIISWQIFSFALNKLISRTERHFSAFSSTYVIIFPAPALFLLLLQQFPRTTFFAYLLWKIARTATKHFRFVLFLGKKMYFNLKLNCKQQQPAADGGICVLTLLLREIFSNANKKTNLKQN